MEFEMIPRKISKLAEYRTELYKKNTWVFFIVGCKDGTNFGGMTKDLARELLLINDFRKGMYFRNHPERVPVKLIHGERVPFKEANAKYSYWKKMDMVSRRKLVATKKWPYKGPWKEFAEKNPQYIEVKKKLTCLRLETIILK